jgi:Flp pilus assembly protein TadG
MLKHPPSPLPQTCGRRRGAFMVLAFAALIAAFAFVAFAIDVGMLAVEKTKLQNACDAASMAAVMELTAAIEDAGPDVEDVTAFAVGSARDVAVQVAAQNGIYIDGNLDVEFGRRSIDAETGQASVTWGVTPSNTVRVRARRDNDDLTAADGKVPVMFAGVGGSEASTLLADAVAYIDSRDIVAVIDFSGSMSHSSIFRQDSINNLGQETIEQNLTDIYNSLELADVGTLTVDPQPLVVYSPPSEDPEDPNVHVTFYVDQVEVSSDQPYDQVKLEFTDGTTQSFLTNESSGTYGGTGTNAGKNIQTAWAIFVKDETVVGQSGSGCKPQVTVTFHGDQTSVSIESTKDLSNVVLEYADGSHQKFDGLNQGQTGTFQGTGANSGKLITGLWVKAGCNQSGDGPGYGERFDSPLTGQSSIAIEFNDTDENVLAYFGLNDVTYPYPSGSWVDYVAYVRNNNDINRGGYKELYGGLTFAHYLLQMQPRGNQTPDLWKTPHFPFHAVKQGVMELADYLGGLGFGDNLGLVSYDSTYRIENYVQTDDASIDITANPITGNYTAVKGIMERKQAAEYNSSTNIAGGIKQAKEMLQTYGREEARPTILLMTDGVPTMGESYTLPGDWDWAELFDYNHDGSADYTVSQGDWGYDMKMSTLVHAKQAVDAGMTIHTLTVGNGADQALMDAIAWLGRGQSLNVPAGLTPEELQAQVTQAFQRLTAVVPPPKLEQ